MELKPRELCEKAWQEIASHFPNFKIIKKGQKIKKLSKNKDVIFEIYFQANRYNYAGSVEFSTHFLISSKMMKKANINNGIIYGGELETIIDRGRNWRWFQLAGASYKYSINEIVELLQKYIMPIFEDFEDSKSNVEKILNKDKKRIDSFYYIYFFAGKEKAQQYFNQFINRSSLKNKYRALYHSLEKIPKENIDINHSEFAGANTIKFAYLNGIELES